MAFDTKWRRDKKHVLENFKIIDNKWICKNPCKVYFPKVYEEKGIAQIENDVNALGICMILVGDTYAVMSVCAMIHFSPSAINTAEMDGMLFYELEFDAGSTVIKSVDVAITKQLTFNVYDCYISKVNIPWYMSYDDMCHIFDSAAKYADAHVANRPEVIELLVSIIARNKDDRVMYYRQIVAKDPGHQKLVFIPINSVEYGATNTINKLGGAYFQTGVASALINPADKVENIEEILRK